MTDIKMIEKFFNDLSSKTKKGEIEWEIANKGEVVTLTFNADYIYRSFKTKLEGGEKCFLVSKKHPSYSDDLNQYLDVIDFSIFITSADGHLIFEVNDDYIPKSDLIRLFHLIAESNVQTKNFFSKFK